MKNLSCRLSVYSSFLKTGPMVSMSDMHHSFKNSVDKTEDTTKRNSLEELVDLNWFALKLPIRFAAKREVVVSYTVDGLGGRVGWLRGSFFDG